MQIAVMGCGTIGQSWVTLFLACGHRVSAYDPDPDAEARIRAHVATQGAMMTELAYPCPNDLSQFAFTTDPYEAVQGALVIQENAPEDLTIKATLFAAIASALDPEAVIISSTSGLTLEALQGIAPNPARLIVGHPFNPPHLIPLVEVLGNAHTAPDVMIQVMQWYRSMGKAPVELKRSLPGHVANRLQAVLWQEAIHLAKEGVATLPEIDQILANGPGLRWALYGPNTLFSMAAGERGMAGFLEHLGPSFQHWWQDAGQVELDDATCALMCEQLQHLSHAQSLDQRARVRDRHLVKMLKQRTIDPLI